jgi:hypothetical protein
LTAAVRPFASKWLLAAKILAETCLFTVLIVLCATVQWYDNLIDALQATGSVALSQSAV